MTMFRSTQGDSPLFSATRWRWLVIGAAVVIALLGPGAGAALGHNLDRGRGSNDHGNNGDHGNKGTVRVVNDDPGRSSGGDDEDAHVGCSFHIELRHFNGGQTGTWHVEAWPPTGNRSTVLSGTYRTDSKGQYRTPTTSLSDGHYKLFVDGRNKHGAKHKTFWVRCARALQGTGSLQINKVVSGTTAGFPGGTFTFRITCGTSSTAASIALGAGVTTGSTTVSGLAAGRSCSVTETASPNAGANASWGATVYSPASPVTIGGGSTVTVTVTNPRSVGTAQTGTLQITKVVGGNTAGFPGGTFSFTATCAGAPMAASITLASGVSVGSTTLSGLAGGTSCAVAETGTPAPGTGASWGAATYSPASIVTIVAGTTVSVTVTNPRSVAGAQTGSLQITKVVSGNTTAFPGGSFTFTATCGGTPVGAAITLGPGVTVGSTSIGGIAAGTSCAVIETGTPGPGAGYVWSSVTYGPANAIVTIVAGSTVTVVVTNLRSVI
jgi:hypothetical protein